MSIRSYLGGLKSWILGPSTRKEQRHGSILADYCYSVWLRHYLLARSKGMAEPKTVGELGPGSSLGLGLSALLSGAQRYFALEAVNRMDLESNRAVLQELVTLFQKRADIPGNDAFPHIFPKLEDYAYPHRFLTSTQTCTEDRLAEIESGLTKASDENIGPVTYICPWMDPRVLVPQSLDFIISQAVLEHIDDLATTYRAMAQWIKPGGYLSHTIDFSSHGTAKAWNGHWAYSRLSWKIIKGRRPYLINRQPLSVHMRALEKQGFEVINLIVEENKDGLSASEVAKDFRQLNPKDLATKSAYILAKAPA